MSYNPDDWPSAWKGHEQFAWFLVQLMDPDLVVELGVDFGFSLIEWARYNKGRTVGIDWFQGDPQAGFRNTEQIARRNLVLSNVQGAKILKLKFEDALFQFADLSIDILHIDGAHDFESVKRDFEMWYPKVRRGGVIVMHDTQSFRDDVGRFFNGLKDTKCEFQHAAGLGVVLKSWR